MLFSESDLQAIAEILAQEVLKKPELNRYENNYYIDAIEPFSPSRAAQIKSKFKSKDNQSRTNTEMSLRDVSGDNIIRRVEVTDGQQVLSPEQNALIEKRKSEQEIIEGLNNLSKKNLPPEEKAKFIEKAGR